VSSRCLVPIDPQILGLPAASSVRASEAKPIAKVSDLTLVLADVGQMAIIQLKHGAIELMTQG
jgi:Serine dehydrogenase proteinase